MLFYGEKEIGLSDLRLPMSPKQPKNTKKQDGGFVHLLRRVPDPSQVTCEEAEMPQTNPHAEFKSELSQTNLSL